MIFFFYGPNTYASRQKIRDMVRSYGEKSGSDWGVQRIDGSTAERESLSATLRSAPFLSRSRLVIVEHLSHNKQAAADIERLITDIPSSTVAVFYEVEPDRRGTFFKTLSTKAKTHKFDCLGLAKLEAWAKKEFERLGAEAEPEAVKRLIEITGDDQWRLSGEIAKLANYRKRIDRQAVSELVVESPSMSIFDLVEAMTSGDLKTALSGYRRLLAQQINEHYILTMVIWQLRNLLLAKTAGAMTPAELAKAAGMSPFVATKAMAKRSEFGQDTLKQAFRLALETDYQIKTGIGDGAALVEKLIYKVGQLVRV